MVERPVPKVGLLKIYPHPRARGSFVVQLRDHDGALVVLTNLGGREASDSGSRPYDRIRSVCRELISRGTTHCSEDIHARFPKRLLRIVKNAISISGIGFRTKLAAV
ncbi:TPA: hypothetical protein HA244_05870 [Candidatus Micrarchaeota archaeon]|nr:hypothetical protein [Candidatus Micrarchaeota archaeon]